MQYISQAEKERVEKAGGRVDFASGKWRVNGRLAVTRSFGDVALKPMVSAVPEIVRRRISANDALLLLSCDGIFDVMENFEVAQFLEERRGKLPLKQLTADLVAEAVRRGGADDITVVLAELDVK